ncbi:hypothetical protein QEN19_003554 [Hanseniaspora menglaensis]
MTDLSFSKRKFDKIDEDNTTEVTNKRQALYSADDMLKWTKREYVTALVSNLPKNTNIKSIDAFFKLCGEIKSTKFIKHKQLAKIQFSSREELMSALTMSFKHFNNNIQSNVLLVKPYENSSAWVTNYPPDYTYVDLKKLFEDAVGKDTIFEVRLPSLKFNSNKRFAYIDFTSAEKCEEAINKMNGTVINELSLIVKLNKTEIDLLGSKSNLSKVNEHSINEKELYLTNLNEKNCDNDIFNKLKVKCGCIDKPNDMHFDGSIKRLSTNSKIGFVVFTEKNCISKIIQNSKTDKNTFFIEFSTNKVFYQKVESKGYLERTKFKKMIHYGARYKDYTYWVSLYPLLEDKINYLNKFQLQKYLEHEVDGIKIIEILLVTDYKGVLIKLDSEQSASKLKLKFDNVNLLRFNNITYANDVVKCGPLLDLVQSERENNFGLESVNKKAKDTKVNLKEDSEFDKNLIKQNNEVEQTTIMKNDDFRNMFL